MTSDDAIPSATFDDEELPRRGVLQGMGAVGIGVGGGMGSPQQIVEAVDGLLSDHEDDPVQQGPHTVATWKAVVDCIIPETPDLATRLGEEHQPGGLAVGLEIGLIEFIDSFLAPEATVPRAYATGETPPLSAVIADILDGAASELIARGGNEDPVKQRFEHGGPFASLSRTDRYRAIRNIETEGGKYGSFVAAIVAAFPAILYYSEWSGYDDFSDKHDRTFSGDVQSWTQTDYPGPTDGFAVLLGYEVRTFEETYDADPETPPGPAKSEGGQSEASGSESPLSLGDPG